MKMEMDYSQIARRFAALPAQSRRAFLDKLAAAGLNFGDLPILPAERGDTSPLSAGQRSLWLTWRLDPASSAYNMPGLLHLRGKVNREALQQSLDDLVSRHEVLRTCYREATRGEPEQVRMPFASMPVVIEDVRGRSEADIADLVDTFATTPFDLERDLPLRAILLQRDEERFIFALSIHHIASDGWSLRILIEELLACYEARVNGRMPDLPPLPIQYADFVHWQHSWLDEAERNRQIGYWRAELGTEHPILQLPADRLRSPGIARRECRHSFHIPANTAASMRALAQSQGATLYMTMLALFAFVLQRCTGQADLRIGTPVLDRRRIETHGVIGYLTNLQVVRAHVDTGTDFKALLAQVREAVLGGQAHQDVSFDALVDSLAGVRQPGVHPLCQVKCTEQQALPNGLEAAGVAFELEELSGGQAHFELSFDFIDSADGIDAVFIYEAGLFDAATVAGWSNLLQDLSEQIARRPDTKLREFLVASPLSTVFGESKSFADTSFNALWGRQLVRFPDREAVRHEAQGYSYAELDAQADRLAYLLRLRGIGAEVRVGIHAPRSAEFILGLLAVLKTGAVCVPLDPQLPTERLAYQLADSGVQMLLSHEVPAWQGGIPMLKLVFEADVSSSQYGKVNATPHPSQAAYVIYTSGSTGRPKGVVISHGALSNYIQAVLERIEGDGIASMAMISTVAADLGHTTLFGALCSGRSLHLISADRAFDPDRFAEYMHEHAVDVLKIVPGHLQALLHAGNPHYVLPRQVLVLGGEAASPSLFERIRLLRPDLRILNHYGPTETTVGVLTYETGLHDAAVQALPVGKPLANIVAHVLDGDLNPVPLGTPGELYLGGAGVARGYQGRPAMTAERFVPDPLLPGARLYRTGDRVRMLRDGNLEFLGRMDDQVKIRGYRVEPREVAAALLAQLGVSTAEAIAVDSGDGRTVLHAYVTGEQLDGEALRGRLAATLPDYMVPAAIGVVDALPRNANGKVDRKLLPVLGLQAAEQVSDAPQGEIEQGLATIWREILRVEHVGRHDNFFGLGGDSILSLQVVARARKAGLRFSPRHLIEKQTIAALAGSVQHAQSAVPHAAGIQERKPEAGVFGLLPVQHWFFEQEMPQAHHWNQAVLLRVGPNMHVEALAEALKKLEDHHDALRSRFERNGDAWHQRHDAASGPVNLVRIDLSGETDLPAAVEREAQQAQQGLHLGHGPIWRAVWMDAGASREGRLLLVCHHLAVDAVSWRILVEDLQRLYLGLVAGGPVSLPPKTSSLRQWHEVLLAYAGQASLQEEIPYWKRQLPGKDQSLPVDVAQGGNTVASESAIELVLDPEATAQLLGPAGSAYRTRPEELLLVALAQTLCSWSKHGSVSIELEGHGREDLFDGVDVSRTAGWFTSLYPVCLMPLADDDERTLMQVKEQLRAVPRKGIGYGILRYLGSREHVAGLSGQPQVTFNYLGRLDMPAASAGAWTLADEKTGQTRAGESPRRSWFDLTLMVRGGRLHIEWGHSRNLHSVETVQRLAETYLTTIKRLIGQCMKTSAGRLTPSDVPLAGLDQQGLDALPVPQRGVRDIYPLSPMQRGMLFHNLLQPDSQAYLNQMCIDIQGLRVDTFKAAWHSALARHAILRTGFLVERDTPLQWVAESADLPFIEHDLRAGADLDQALDALAKAEMTRGVDLARPPLMRIALARTAQSDYRLIWTCHHLLMDGWSSSQLLAEVLSQYAGASVDGPSGTYRDHIAWLKARDAASSASFWQRRLQSFEQPTLLCDALGPVPEPSGASVAHGHGDYVSELEPEFTARLNAFARAGQVTLNTLVQAAWVLLLQRHTGQRSVTFGVTVSGRPSDLPDAERILGLFINTLPLTASPLPEQEVAAWLRELQADNFAMREHEHTPLYDIQRWAGHGGQAMFDTLIVFENYPMDAVLQALENGPGGIRIGTVTSRDDTHYPFTVTVSSSEQGGKAGLRLHFSHDRLRIGAQTAALLAAQMRNLLTMLVDAPSAALGTIDLLTADEHLALKQLGWNRERHPTGLPVHRLIEQQVRLAPQATALVLGEETLGYDQLNRRANQLAHRLIACGIGAEVRVGIALERSIDMIVAVLAVLKAGGAYVPLDPAYPRARLQAMIEDSGVAMLLTQSAFADVFADHDGLQVMQLDAVDLCNENDANPDVVLHPENLAYVIYTSGSTGKPKGIAIAHHALVEHAQVAVGYFGLTAVDRMLQFSTINFDGFVEQLFPPLVAGAAVVLRGPELWDSETFYRELIERHVTIADLTTAYWNMLAHDFALHGVRQYGRLRQVQATGETMPPEALQAWRAAGLGQVKLLNTYGPTETTVTATAYDCRDQLNGTKPIPMRMPIGKPLAGRDAYVLDGDLRAVAPGSAGELCFGGSLLARAYAGRPGLTAERFVADPFDEAGGRLYRTGDLVRWDGEGQLEYLGRIDHQVKIRGFRIELGELESHLAAYAGVREVLAMAVDAPGGLRLVAYIAGPADLDARLLRKQLEIALPDYMVPAAIIVLERLPLNPNGKIDRKALPLPSFEDGSLQELSGPVEQALAAIWMDLLGLRHVGRDTHFFSAGGHSLLAIQLTSRIRAEMKGELPLRAVFANPLLQDMALQIRFDAVNDIPVPVARGETMPLSPVQQRLWMVDRLAAGTAGHLRAAYNIAAALRFHGPLDGKLVQLAVNALVARHEVLRTAYPESVDGDPVAVILPKLELPLPQLDWTREPAERRQAMLEGLLAEQRSLPFDLARPPLLRMSLLRCAEHDQVLLLCIHHMVFDGWSESVFMREFGEIYAALHEGRDARLVPLALQYADYAAWQAQRFAKHSRQAASAFWRDYLAGAPVLSGLPQSPGGLQEGGDSGQPGKRHAGARVVLGEALAQKLNQVALSHDTTLFAVLLAAFFAVVHIESGSTDLVIGTDVSGRDRLELEGLIGFFVNVLPLRSRIDPSFTAVSFVRLLEQVKGSVLSAFDHQDMPFDQIVDATGVPRLRGRHALVQTLFVLQNVPTAQLQIPGLEVELLPDEGAQSKFDLGVFVAQVAGELHAEWIYSAEHLDRVTVDRASNTWQAILEQAADSAEAPLSQFNHFRTKENILNPTAAGKLDRLKKIAKRDNAPSVAAKPAVSMSFLAPGREFPIVIEAQRNDLDPAAWARENRDLVESMLARHAGILFRGFGLRTPQEFEAFAEAIEPQLHGSYGDLPKKEGGRNIYRSTPYPERQMILFHNESSHMAQWPRKQWFFCEQPSPVGGATPIVDCREVLKRLPPALVEEFERKQLLYIRTFNHRLDVSWQDFFKTDSRAEVELRLNSAGIEFTWLDNDELQTRTRCPAVITHPGTGERVFFNQVQLHHVRCLEPELREDLLAAVGLDRLPRQVRFGDGSPIDDATMDLIGRVYEECAVRFDWRQGDIVMLDNMLAAHARDPYEGPRKIVVAMGEMVSRSELEQETLPATAVSGSETDGTSGVLVQAQEG